MMEEIIQAIRDERARQDLMWGAATERNLSPQSWNTILMEEVGEVARASLEGDPVEYVEELVQVAAVAVAALEDHYEQQTTPPIVEDSSSDNLCIPPGGGSSAAIEYIQEEKKQ
ncbi:hypothetical protein LCGC14_3108130 [marine sediment metagenome]|uniref:Uncharacterized protein n=1 Tax=marine sediment metagenome TaxID=412755 RepID=A0A0F8W687_9ZZZZ